MEKSSLRNITASESDALQNAIEGATNSLRCASPAIIQSFDPTTQTAKVQPAINDRRKENGEIKSEQLPLLNDVPVIFPKCKDFAITLPIQEGDFCLLVYCDSCIDAFIQNGVQSEQVETRHHDLSDAIAIVGLSAGEPFPNYDPENIVIRNKENDIKITVSKDTDIKVEAKGKNITISSSGVSIEGDLTVNGNISSSQNINATGTVNGVNI